MKKDAVKSVALSIAILAAVAYGGIRFVNIAPLLGALKVWNAADRINASDLNNNFTYVLSKAGHTNSANILDGDINATAQISHPKMRTPALLPKAWALVGRGGVCNGAAAADSVTCVMDASSQFTSVKSSGTAGTYRVTLAYTPPNINFAVLATSGTAALYCTVQSTAITAPHYLVACVDAAGTATNATFSTLVMDNDN